MTVKFSKIRLDKKVVGNATITRGIVGGFEFTVLQRNLKNGAREAMDLCLPVLDERKATKAGSTASVRNSVLIIYHITFQDCRVHIFF